MDTVKVKSRFWVMPSSNEPKLNSSLPSKENNMLSIILPKLHDFKINIKGLSKETWPATKYGVCTLSHHHLALSKFEIYVELDCLFPKVGLCWWDNIAFCWEIHRKIYLPPYSLHLACLASLPFNLSAFSQVDFGAKIAYMYRALNTCDSSMAELIKRQCLGYCSKFESRLHHGVIAGSNGIHPSLSYNFSLRQLSAAAKPSEHGRITCPLKMPNWKNSHWKWKEIEKLTIR